MENSKNPEKSKNTSKIVRVISIIAILVVVIAAMIVGLSHNNSEGHKVWDEQTTVGNLEAENHFIIYSDIVCPYCVAFENAIIENEDEFQKYIKDNDVLVEVRLSDFLYEYGQTNPITSRWSAEGVFCAKKEGKFWEYYNHVIPEVWNNYFSKNGKNAFMELEKLGKDYWIKLGKDIGLGESFENCVKNDETLEEVISVAAKTIKQINGMPYFKFNNYISSGFDLSWGWDYVKMYFDSGLRNK